jgi:hypothetical protein
LAEAWGSGLLAIHALEILSAKKLKRRQLHASTPASKPRSATKLNHGRQLRLSKSATIRLVVSATFSPRDGLHTVSGRHAVPGLELKTDLRSPDPKL